MSAKEFAAQLRREIESLKAGGTAAIYSDNLINYLRQVEANPEPESSPAALEEYRASLQQLVESHKHTLESNLEMFRSVIAYGQEAMKAAFLLSGGAAVALLAFISHLAEHAPARVPVFAQTLMPFTLAVLTVVVTSGFAYLAQWFYATPNGKAEKVGLGLNITCIVLMFVAYGLFIWGLCSPAATQIPPLMATPNSPTLGSSLKAS